MLSPKIISFKILTPGPRLFQKPIDLARLFRFCESGHIENKTVARSKSVAFENYLAFLICHFYHSLTKILPSATAVLSAAFKASFFLFALPFSFFCRANCLSFRQLLQFKQSHLFGQRLFAELQKYLINNSSSRNTLPVFCRCRHLLVFRIKHLDRRFLEDLFHEIRFLQ